MFRSFYGKFHTLWVTSAAMAREVAAVDGPFGIFAIDAAIRDQGPKELNEYLQDLVGDRPVLFFGRKAMFNDRKLNEVYGPADMVNFLEIPFQGSQLQDVINKFIGWYEKEFGEVTLENPEDELLGMRIKNFYFFKKVLFDVYVKVDEHKFILLANKDRDFPQALVAEYARKQVKFLYLYKSEFITNLEKSLDNMSKALTKNIDRYPVYLKLQIRGVSFIHDYIRNIGISESLQEHILSFYESSLQLVAHSKKIEKVIEDFPYAGEYLAEQAVLGLYLGEYICRKLGYISEFPRKKLGLSAIIHDAMLDNEELANVRYLEEDSADQYSPEDLQDLKEHPVKAAEVSEMFMNFTESDYLITQHHEFPWPQETSRIGFPGNIQARKISNLSAVFIIISQFCTILCEHKGDLDQAQEDIYDLLKAANTRIFKEPAEILYELFYKSKL
jgi:hypothetical protein